MGIRHLALAGALFLGAFGAIGAAAAADLRLPSPPPIAPEPVAFGGWYLRGDVGASIYSSGSWEHGAITNTNTAVWNDHTAGNAGFVGAGVGYQFDWGAVYATWRYLDYDFKSGQALQSLNLNGGLIGVSFRF